MRKRHCKKQTTEKSTKGKTRRKKKGGVSPLTFVGVLFGMAMLAYPFLADWHANIVAEQAVDNYASSMDAQSQAEKEFLLAQADAYNKMLAGDTSGYEDHPQYSRDYWDQLSTDTTGMIGTIEIPKHGILQPIYKGTSEDVLMSGTGHLETTSLPIGGLGTHAMISGHTGMPGQRMFDDVRDMEPGDIVKVTCVDRVTYYQMDKSEQVEPGYQLYGIDKDVAKLTLVTCTPYGINDHRLLVECHQVDYTEEQVAELEAQAASRLDAYLNARTIPFIIATLVVVLFGIASVIGKVRSRKKAKTKEETRTKLAEGGETKPETRSNAKADTDLNIVSNSGAVSSNDGENDELCDDVDILANLPDGDCSVPEIGELAPSDGNPSE